MFMKSCLNNKKSTAVNVLFKARTIIWRKFNKLADFH